MTDRNASDRARHAAIDRFLVEAGWDEAMRAPLAGDASNRRYERLRHSRLGPAVVMDAPPERGEDVRPFAALTGTLRARGYSAPEIYAIDADAGFLLLEDLGDDLFARVAAHDRSREAALYDAAVAVLVDLHDGAPTSTAAGSGLAHPVAPYDQAALAREAALAVDWWRPGATGERTSPDLRAEYLERVQQVCAGVADDRSTLVLRDYHAENLIWLPERAGVAQVGLLDYQDALIGHPAYDLASLLEDARRDVRPDFAAGLRDQYIRRAGVRDAAAFEAAYCALAAQRNLKIIGIFARLWLRDGKDRYLQHIPRVWRYLQRDLAHPSLAPLRAWIDLHLPAPEPDALAHLRGASILEAGD